jgi:hypothetical protein
MYAAFANDAPASYERTLPNRSVGFDLEHIPRSIVERICGTT